VLERRRDVLASEARHVLPNVAAEYLSAKSHSFFYFVASSVPANGAQWVENNLSNISIFPTGIHFIAA
jgi:hypothetical protein